MHLTAPATIVEIGRLRLSGVQTILERPEQSLGKAVVTAPKEVLADIRRRMAVVVPCKDEPLGLIRGVLGAIPPEVVVVLVSNSRPERFALEEAELIELCRAKGQVGIACHQQERRLAGLLGRAGLEAIVDQETGRVRNGKGEGMLLGIIHAYLADVDYVGFVDADNHLPASVAEYVDAFAAGFHISSEPERMVRIRWRSKPKMVDGSLVPKRSGRVSTITNRYLNRLVGHHFGREVGIVQTGNAGEHAMTLSLASRLRLSGGFSAETHQIVDLLETFGTDHESAGAERAEVLQIETRLPHLHLERGATHLPQMKRVSLATIHQSKATPAFLRSQIEEELGGSSLPSPAVYPPIAQLDWDLLREEIPLEGLPTVPYDRRRALPPS